jgi:2-polyprenyl-6-methoxyphenol hydroxylase-like FAD-dependent oxidoreductase
MDVVIIGGGICGLSLALNLKQRGIDCRVYERTPEIKPLGVGITLLPHAMREFNALRLGDELKTVKAASSIASASSSTRSRAANTPAILTRKSASIAAACT